MVLPTHMSKRAGDEFETPVKRPRVTETPCTPSPTPVPTLSPDYYHFRVIKKYKTVNKTLEIHSFHVNIVDYPATVRMDLRLNPWAASAVEGCCYKVSKTLFLPIHITKFGTHVLDQATKYPTHPAHPVSISNISTLPHSVLELTKLEERADALSASYEAYLLDLADSNFFVYRSCPVCASGGVGEGGFVCKKGHQSPNFVYKYILKARFLQAPGLKLEVTFFGVEVERLLNVGTADADAADRIRAAMTARRGKVFSFDFDRKFNKDGLVHGTGSNVRLVR